MSVHLCVIFYFTIDKIENLLMLPSPEMLKIIKMSVTIAEKNTFEQNLTKLDNTLVKFIRLPRLISEEGCAKTCELVDIDRQIPEARC